MSAYWRLHCGHEITRSRDHEVSTVLHIVRIDTAEAGPLDGYDCFVGFVPCVRDLLAFHFLPRNWLLDDGRSSSACVVRIRITDLVSNQ